MQNDVIYQFSLSDALLNSLYDGEFSIKEILSYGNFGLGTINGLDGELIIIDKKAFTADIKGKLTEVDALTNCPLAVITTFSTKLSFKVKNLNLNETFSFVNNYVENRKRFFCLKN